MEELEQALREKGLLDGRDIKDIVAEVDADNVSHPQHSHLLLITHQHVLACTLSQGLLARWRCC